MGDDLVTSSDHKKRWDFGIWGFAFGYFACYIPYSALTKGVSGGLLDVLDGPVPGFTLLPVSVCVSMVSMLVFITVMKWWQFAGRKTIFGRDMPCPNRWTFASGLCTAGIIGTTTLAYTMGESIVFMMLLMRGGVLILAPLVDTITGRHVRWFSAMGLVMSLGALVVAFVGKRSFSLSLIATLDIALYLSCYFIRLQFMSKLAKSDDPDARTRYFVEEQMVASPSLVITLIVLALIDVGQPMHDVRAGFTTFLSSPVLVHTIFIGILSQGTGIFGSLIFLAFFVGSKPPSSYQLGGAGLIIGAILFLTIPPLMEKRRKAAAAA